MASILITGSGSGIGAATARRLVKQGDFVLIHARHNRQGVDDLVEEMKQRGASATGVLGDPSEEGVAAALVRQAVTACGGLDVLVHAAGFPVRAQVGTATASDLDHAVRAITGSFLGLITEAAPHLVASKAGRVVAVSTHNAHVYRCDYPVYPVSGAAKAGLEAMAKAFGVQMAPHGITINVVVPGLIRKEHGEQFLDPEEWLRLPQVIPMGRIGEADEVAALIAFLASADASYITGQVMHVNGGLV